MSDGLKTIIYPVSDLGAAKAMFQELLGIEPYADAPYYVGFKVNGQDIGLDPNGKANGHTGPVGYYHVADLAGRLKALTAAGAEIVQDTRDVGGGRLIASVRDTDGNVIGLLQEA